jgi:hypothetical protein
MSLTPPKKKSLARRLINFSRQVKEFESMDPNQGLDYFESTFADEIREIKISTHQILEENPESVFARNAWEYVCRKYDSINSTRENFSRNCTRGSWESSDYFLRGH